MSLFQRRYLCRNCAVFIGLMMLTGSVAVAGLPVLESLSAAEVQPG